jgi:hypothetical protein
MSSNHSKNYSDSLYIPSTGVEMGTGDWQKPTGNKKPKSGTGFEKTKPVATVKGLCPAFKSEDFPPLGTVDSPTTTKKS